MTKYSIKLINDYILGNDIENYNIEDLENDYEFMKLVILYSKDKNMYNLCSEELKNNYEFIKFVINTFKNDISFVRSIVDPYLENTNNEIEQIEICILMGDLTKNCDENISFKYNLFSMSFYNCLAIDIEVYKRKENWIGQGFIVVYELYKSSKIITDFLATKFVINIFSDELVDLEELLHKKYKTYDRFIEEGKNNFLFRIISLYDSSLTNYLKNNIKILDILDEKLNYIKNNWNMYNENKEYNMYSMIIEEVHQYMKEFEFECIYSEEEILYFIANELNIKDKIQKYDFIHDDIFEFINEYNDDYTDEEYDLEKDIPLINNDDILDETIIDKEKFNFSEYKHYLNIKKIVKQILKNNYDEYEKNDISSKKTTGKIIKFNKKMN